MADNLNFADESKPAIPSMLNVLTILTFIGSGIAAIYLLFLPKIMSFFKGIMDKAVSSGQELSAKQMDDIEKGRKATDLAIANMAPIVITGIIATALCIAGAVMMRKLKKDGFWIYLGGELLPLIAGFVLMGTQQYTGVMSIVLGVGLPVAFIILYASQRKYLVN